VTTAEPGASAREQTPAVHWRGWFTALLVALAALAVVRLCLAAGTWFEPLVPMPGPAPEPQQADEAPLAALPEPAAGPGEDAGPPDAAAAGAPAPKAPGAPPPLDRARLSASEIAVLHQLAGRREALDQRARALDERGVLIETAAADLERQLAALRELRDQILALVETHDAEEEAELASLIKIYETMKPKAAAEIFDRLEMLVLIRVVEGMREAKAADVLARMDPVKARQVTTELARRTDLLDAVRDAGTAAAQPASGS
jgi:flagellar motility protein MotE (MotC chaperone)